MLIVYTGSDWGRLNREASDLIRTLSIKQPDAEVINLDQVNQDELLSLAYDQGLFFQKSLVRLPKILGDQTLEELFKNSIESLQQSPSIFVWAESGLNATWLKRLEKVGAKVSIIGQTASTRPDYSVFKVSDALLSGDSKKLWQSLIDAQAQGIEAENVFGTLWWQLKSIIMARESKTATEAGLKPYTYNGITRSNWSAAAARSMMTKLIQVQSNVKQKGRDMYQELQALALKVL